MRILVVIIIVLAIAAGIFVYRQDKKEAKQSEQISPPQAEQSQPNDITTTPFVKTYTMEEVAAHGLDQDSEECWTVIHGKVYDILEFASNNHPGGELIFQACGIDATKLFETRPMGSKTPHSENARKILEEYYIGDLKK